MDFVKTESADYFKDKNDQWTVRHVYWGIPDKKTEWYRCTAFYQVGNETAAECLVRALTIYIN